MNHSQYIAEIIKFKGGIEIIIIDLSPYRQWRRS